MLPGQSSDRNVDREARATRQRLRIEAWIESSWSCLMIGAMPRSILLDQYGMSSPWLPHEYCCSSPRSRN